MSYSASEVAKKTGMSVYTIRYYAKQGIFPHLRRDHNDVRQFEDEDLHWLYLIQHLKRTGMTIKEIKQFILWCTQGAETIDLRLDFWIQKEKEVMAQIESLKETLDFITYKKWEYQKASEMGSTKFMKKMDRNLIPADIIKIMDTVNRERDFPASSL